MCKCECVFLCACVDFMCVVHVHTCVGLNLFYYVKHLALHFVYEKCNINTI